MNIKRKIYSALILLLAIFTAVAITAVADGTVEYDGTVAEAQTLLDTVNRAVKEKDKNAAISALDIYLRDKRIDPSEDGYDALVFSVQSLYLAEIDLSNGASKSGAMIRRLHALLNKYPLDSSNESAEGFMTEFTSKEAEYDRKVAENKTEIEDGATLSDYSSPLYMNNSFENGGDGEFIKQNEKYGDVTAFIGIEKGMDGDNSYYSIKYDHAGVPRIYYEMEPVEDNFVFDFDVTTFTHLPNKNIRFERGSVSVNGVSLTPSYLQITPEGHLYTNGNIILYNAITAGQWTHITIVLDVRTAYATIYVDYEKVIEFFTSKKLNGEPLIYDMDYLRIQSTNDDIGSSVSFDNCIMYSGATLRDVNKFERMTDDERMLHYTDVFNDWTNDIVSRKIAYDKATELLPKYWRDNGTSGEYLTGDERLISAVDSYRSFDYKGLIKVYSDENLKAFIALCDELLSVERTPSTFDRRRELIAEIEEFSIKNEGFITDNDSYQEYLAKLQKVSIEVNSENQINLFIEAVKSFYSASGYVYVEKAYQSMKEIYNSGLDFSLAENESFVEFRESLNKYDKADVVLYDELCIDNAKKFIAYMNVISLYKTEEEWLANYDFLNSYVLAARELINGECFDPYYSNVQELLEEFEAIDTFFYNKLVQEHKIFIENKLAELSEITDYIAAFGVCNEIARYFSDNKINEDEPQLASLVSEYREYLRALESEREEYYAVLEANTVEFVAIVDELMGKDSYTDKVDCVERASVYYSAINTVDSRAIEAVKYYETILAEIESVRRTAEEFKSYVMMLKSEDDILYALGCCSAMLDSLEMAESGVRESVDTYNSALQTYMSNVDSVNSDISCTLSAVNAFINTAKTGKN